MSNKGVPMLDGTIFQYDAASKFPRSLDLSNYPGSTQIWVGWDRAWQEREENRSGSKLAQRNEGCNTTGELGLIIRLLCFF